MNNDNNKPNIIDAQTNAKYLDTIGETLVKFVRQGKNIDSQTALMLALLLAECRNYSTVRDEALLQDETSKIMRDHLARSAAAANQEEEVSVSDAADEIINDLRKSGINL